MTSDRFRRNINEDFSQANNLVDKCPDKLKQLQDAFDAEAKKDNFYPLDSSRASRADPAIRPSLTRGRRRVRLLPRNDSHPGGFGAGLQEIILDCVDQNIQFWTNSLEVASLIASPALCTVAKLQPNSTRYCVSLGEGDEHSGCVYFKVEGPEPKLTDYEAVATLMTGWRNEFNTHLFFLSRFLNIAFPPETRWLNGYRLLEWHFMRGRTGLASSSAWRCFLEEHGASLDPFLLEQQTRHGLFEETRALVTHAMLQNRPDPDKDGATLDLVTKTFKSLERLVVHVMNEGAKEGILWP